jgi:hypothetical protein
MQMQPMFLEMVELERWSDQEDQSNYSIVKSLNDAGRSLHRGQWHHDVTAG